MTTLSGGGSSGVTTVVILVAVLLAAGGLPALSAHAPIDEVSSGDQPAFDSADGFAEPAQSDDEVHDDVAEPAAELGLGESIEGVAGVLALLFGAEGVDGAVGDSTELLQETDADQSSSDDDHTQDTADDGSDSDDETTAEGSASDDGTSDDGTSDDETTAEGSTSDTAAEGSDGSSPDSEGLADSVDLTTVGLAIGAVGALLAGVFIYRTGMGIIAFVIALPRLFASAVTAVLFGIVNVVERAVAAIGSAAIHELPGQFFAAVVGTVRSAGHSLRSLFSRGDQATAAGAGDTIASDREQIRSTWRTVIDAVSVDHHAAHTPGEIKHRAVETGLPEPAVTTLLGAFRDVEYGGKDPSERATGAVDAANSVETAAEDADTEGDE